MRRSGDPLMKSNVFTLLPPDSYTGGSTCSVAVIDNVTCADLPVHSELNTLHDTSIVTLHLYHFDQYLFYASKLYTLLLCY